MRHGLGCGSSVFGGRNPAQTAQSIQYRHLASFGPARMAQRAAGGGAACQTSQQGALPRAERGGVYAEIEPGRRIYADRMAAQIDMIQIEGKDIVPR